MSSAECRTFGLQVVRREADAPHGLRTYVHIGTGNYNPSTAAVYTDLGLLSCNPAICNDVVDIFKHLTGQPAVEKKCVQLCADLRRVCKICCVSC